MKRSLSIDNHSGFQWTVLRTTLAGGLVGFFHELLGASSGYLAEISGLRGSWTWLYGVTAVALLGAAAIPPLQRRQSAWLGACAVFGGISSWVGMHWGFTSDFWQLAGPIGLAAALALYLAQGLPRWHALFTAVVSGLVAFAAQKVPPVLGAHDALLELPRSVATIVTGLSMGLVVGSGTVARHLRILQIEESEASKLEKELAGLLPPAQAEDEIAKLVRHAATSYQQAAEALDEHPQARAAAAELVKKIARFGKKWQDIESQAKKSDRTELDQRVAELEKRREQSTDESVKSEYEKALAALREQVTYLNEIGKGRERAVARLHLQVATLDRLRLAAVRHRSASASKLGEELRSVVDDLNQAGQDLDTAAEVLAELPS